MSWVKYHVIGKFGQVLFYASCIGTAQSFQSYWGGSIVDVALTNSMDGARL